MKLEIIKNMIRGSFGADAFALGYHWTYDPNLNYQTITKNGLNYISPLAKKYHSRGKGELSLYGDQNLALLESMTLNKKFLPKEFYKIWKGIWKPDYNEWIDQATRVTLEIGRGSSSNDLSPVGRISPLFLEENLDIKKLDKNIEDYIKITHDSIEVIEFGKFIGNLIVKLSEEKLDDLQLFNHLNSVKKKYPNIEKYIDIAMEIQDKAPEDVINIPFPTSCEIDASGPLTIYLFLKFRKNYEELFEWNAIFDGDTCSRASILAMLLCVQGIYPEFIKNWFQLLKRNDEIDEYINKF